MTLHWDRHDPAGLAGYRVYRAITNHGPWALLTPTLLTFPGYCDFDPANGRTNRYRITAVSTASEESPPSMTLEAAAQPFVLMIENHRTGRVWQRFMRNPEIQRGLARAGFVAVQLGKESEGGIFAYDLTTGDLKWKWTEEGPGYASPVPASVAGTPMIVTLTAKSVVAVSSVNGTVLWRAPYAPQGMAYNAATPIVDGATVIYCGQGRDTTAVTLDKQGNEFVAKELWKNPDNAVQFSTPVLRGGFLFGLSARSDFFCINAKDGKTAWTAPLTPPTAGTDAQPQPPGQGGMRGGRGMGRTAGYGSIVDAGSVLFALTPASQLVAFEPSEKAYTELARIKVADSPTYACPIVSGKRLFIKDQDAVTLWNLE